jgi:hypothetical protein
MKVKSEYRDLSRQELLDRIYQLGADFERYSGSCSQCTVAALQQVLGFEDVIVRVASSSCGGQTRKGEGTCGAVVGGTLVLDYFFGRPASSLSIREKIAANSSALSNAISVASALTERHLKEYGSILCPGIQTRLFGRSFHIENPQEAREFEAAGGHSDPTKCISVVGRSSRWVMEILLDKGAVEL